MWNMLKFMMNYFAGTNLYVNPDELVFSLNKEYFDVEMDTQKLQVLFTAMLEGELPRVDWHRVLMRIGVVPDGDSFEEFEERLADTGRGLM